MIQGEGVMNEERNILIIEDDESARKTLILVLAKKGYATETTRTGTATLQAIDQCWRGTL